jgi:hypothetical protein
MVFETAISTSDFKLKAEVEALGVPITPSNVKIEPTERNTSATISLTHDQPFTIRLNASNWFYTKDKRNQGMPDPDTIRRNQSQPNLNDCNDLRVEVYFNGTLVRTGDYACVSQGGGRRPWTKGNNPSVKEKDFRPFCCNGHIEIKVFRGILKPSLTSLTGWECVVMWDTPEEPFYTFDIRYETVYPDPSISRPCSCPIPGAQVRQAGEEQLSQDSVSHQRMAGVEEQEIAARREVEQVNAGRNNQESETVEQHDRSLEQQRERDRQQLEVARGLNQRERLLDQRERAQDERERALDERECALERREREIDTQRAHLEEDRKPVICEVNNENPEVEQRFAKLEEEMARLRCLLGERKGKDRAPSLSGSSSKRARPDDTHPEH